MTIFIKEGRIALISGGKSNFVVIERHSLGGRGNCENCENRASGIFWKEWWRIEGKYNGRKMTRPRPYRGREKGNWGNLCLLWALLFSSVISFVFFARHRIYQQTRLTVSERGTTSGKYNAWKWDICREIAMIYRGKMNMKMMDCNNLHSWHFDDSRKATPFWKSEDNDMGHFAGRDKPQAGRQALENVQLEEV